MATRTYKAKAEAASAFLRTQAKEANYAHPERVSYEQSRLGDIASLLTSMQTEIGRLHTMRMEALKTLTSVG